MAAGSPLYGTPRNVVDEEEVLDTTRSSKTPMDQEKEEQDPSPSPSPCPTSSTSSASAAAAAAAAAVPCRMCQPLVSPRNTSQTTKNKTTTATTTKRKAEKTIGRR